jgi:hypothetical protein
VLVQGLIFDECLLDGVNCGLFVFQDVFYHTWIVSFPLEFGTPGDCW